MGRLRRPVSYRTGPSRRSGNKLPSLLAGPVLYAEGSALRSHPAPFGRTRRQASLRQSRALSRTPFATGCFATWGDSPPLPRSSAVPPSPLGLVRYAHSRGSWANKLAGDGALLRKARRASLCVSAPEHHSLGKSDLLRRSSLLGSGVLSLRNSLGFANGAASQPCRPSACPNFSTNRRSTLIGAVFIRLIIRIAKEI